MGPVREKETREQRVAWEGGGVRAPLPQLEGMPPWLEGMCPEPAGPGVPQFENPHLEITEDITL